MAEIKLDSIGKNTFGFKFVEALGSFINNSKFKEGFNQFSCGLASKDTYIWHALSCIGEKYGDVIYENVINYLDNAANVDLCKIKALQSMMQVVGVKYDVLDAFSHIPVEIANLMDLFSVNHKYLVDSKTFKQEFIDQLSAFGVVRRASPDSADLDTMLSDTQYELSSHSRVSADTLYVDDQQYANFLSGVYKNVLTSMVYMQYADAENGLSTQHDYIYEYIQSEILADQQAAGSFQQTAYQEKISQLKVQYGIDKSFDQEAIVDSIEDGYDSYDNYNVFQQQILDYEIRRRQETYAYAKTYDGIGEVGAGHNLTRFSYYREKKVKQYFKFIEDTYNNLIVEDSIKNAVENDLAVTIQSYKHDINYFDIDQSVKQPFLKYDDINNAIEVQTDQIIAIVQLLVSQTMAIADIRDQVKTQIRKSYMRGTFLLISYIVNEFLKYNIAEKYGSTFQTEDTGVDLGTILSTSIAEGDNVELIEYYDDTEYFNISRDVDAKAKYSDTVNEKFWDNIYNKIGKTTEDLPLAEIENFYLKQLKLEDKKVDDIVNFLSIIYEYGANNSYISRSTGEYTCMISGRSINAGSEYIGDPFNSISTLQSDILSVNAIHAGIDKYIEAGAYVEGEDTIAPMSAQIDELCVIVSAYYWQEISTANESLKEKTLDQICADFDAASTIAEAFDEISASYEDLKSDSKYAYYLQNNTNNNYVELPGSNIKMPYFIEKLHNFKLSIDGGIDWRNNPVYLSLDAILENYYALSSDLFNRLFALSVWPVNTVKQPTPAMYYNKATTYWPHYSPNYDNELTTVTLDLKNYLTSEAQVQHDNAIQHLQNHYDKLLGYKEDINRIFNECNEAIAKYDAMRIGVEAVSKTSMDNSFSKSYVIDVGPVYKMKWVWNDPTDKSQDGYYDIDGIASFNATEVTSFNSPSINSSDSIETKLSKLAKRTQFEKYTRLCYGKILMNSNEAPDEGSEYFTERKGHDYHWVLKEDGEIVDEGWGHYYSYTYKSTDGTWYDKDVYFKPWDGAYSQSTANNILATLRNAIDHLKNVVALANSELDCLGSAFQKITLQTNINIDNVRDCASDAYSKITGRIDSLDNYIFSTTEANGWQSLTSDSNLLPFMNRLKSISAINLSAIEEYNIRYIDTKFYEYALSVQRVLYNNSEYFDTYVNNDADRLDKQISAMYDYMAKRDAQASAEVLSTTLDISAKYYAQLDEFSNFSLLLNRKTVDSINDDYSYNLQATQYREEVYSKISAHQPDERYIDDDPSWPHRMEECLDYLLCGDYVETIPHETLSGVLYWLPWSQQQFEDSIVQQINAKIPQLPEYIETMDLLETAKLHYASRVKDEEMVLTKKLDAIVEDLEAEIVYISGQIPFYEKSHEIYLKYNGTEIGYDPFYCYKNMAYSSYQIHPYLYNFVEKSNLLYPLANNFFISFSDEYEGNLVKKGIDNILGQYGNVKNIWKSGLFDWTSYQSKYEHQAHKASTAAAGAQHPNIGYTGLFYPPAIAAFLADRDKFLQDVQDDTPDSYYHHLNLPSQHRLKIYEQLLAYEYMLRDVATAQSTSALSGEYDIYKYAEDCMGNSIFLLKSYKHLYEQHKGDSSYRPSYHEKRNTLGEIWMRVKDHPLAFPAIDLRAGCAGISQYSISAVANSYAADINSYVRVLNDYFTQLEDTDGGSYETALLTRDTIGLYQISGLGQSDIYEYDKVPANQSQHLRCFFDFETDPLNQSLLLVVPFRTGQNWQNVYYPIDQDTQLSTLTRLDASNVRYADSSIVVAYLGDHVLFNSTSDQTYVYWFKTDVYTPTNSNIDNIQNKQMLVNGSLDYDGGRSKQTTYFTEFIGFAKNQKFVYAVYARKYVTRDGGFTFVHNNSKFYKPSIELEYTGYAGHMLLETKHVQSDSLLYDVYDYNRDADQQQALGKQSYKNASNIAFASGNGYATVGFLTSRRQTYGDSYGSNSKIVNFTEYTTQMESYNTLSTSGENLEYPKSTALIQTTDSQHINIYNSFDSFVQQLVNVTFKFLGTSLEYDSTRYFNLNSDLGYLPQYVDKPGVSYYCRNTALCSAQQYSIELLGPEKTDIEFTPVINQTEDEKYGRVVEDYKDATKLSAFNDTPLLILKDSRVASYTFDLSTVYVNGLVTGGTPRAKAEEAWLDLIETPDLLDYKYIVFNTNYLAMPILKGNLSDLLPNGYYYQGSELYDLLSGEEIIGPNQTTYQSINMTNHIDNISTITANVEFDTFETMLPSALTLSCIARLPDPDGVREIEQGTFFMLMYQKNNLLSYKYHHLFENANKNISQKVNMDQTWSLDLSKQSVDLSDVSIDGSIYPFKSINPGQPYNKLSAQLEFKYSEEDTIRREFPNIDPIDVEDEITIVQNDSQSIYYFAVDDYTSLSLDVFKMDVYHPAWEIGSLNGRTSTYKINPLLPKYRDFYSRALVIEAAYNLEKKLDDSGEYEVVQYFNYKNFTNPQYVSIKWPDDRSLPPEAHTCESIDPSIEHTYLVLRPGQSGRLDIRVDFVFYQKLKRSAINQSIVGACSQTLQSYYIMNVSDEKPKFIISRKPFVAYEGVEETGNYELEDAYHDGMTFRYAMMVVQRTRASDASTSPLNNYVAMSQLAFWDKNHLERFEYPTESTVDIADGITPPDKLIVWPNEPVNLLSEDEDKEFFASDLHLRDSALSIMIDFKSEILDIQQYPVWSWFNSHCSNSHIGYMPKTFYLAFSNDKRRWYKADEFDDVKNSLKTTNYAEAYKAEMHIDEQ